MEAVELDIVGCYLIKPRILEDDRGCFIKTLNKDFFEENGLFSGFQEEYYSISSKNVLRGMHFQKPPSEHVKLVYCISGEVEDVFLDLRKGSKTYKKFQNIRLDDRGREVLYLPQGIAHGFVALSDKVTMIYKTSSCYNPAHDDGVLWSSFGMDWVNIDPILSSRDEGFLKLEDFESPFL